MEHIPTHILGNAEKIGQHTIRHKSGIKSKSRCSTIFDTTPGLLFYLLRYAEEFSLLLPIFGESVQNLCQRHAFGGFAAHYCRDDVGSKVDQSYTALNRCFGLDGHRPELWR